ncbi:beta strand repeat-containing protein [Selenomonas felix]|uniref:beta strand repeat-containing protein n=1 Tax=Selenomonas felix TaxID=1944634 RepID=UPI001FE7E157|nr:MBG domain-containing protein [Selenomonas felix]
MRSAAAGRARGRSHTPRTSISSTARLLTGGAAALKNGAGALKLKASGTLAVEGGAQIASTGAAQTAFEANSVSLGTGAKVKTAGGTINVKTDALSLPAGETGVLSSANGAVTIETRTAGKTMSVNAPAASPAADIAMADLSFIDSGTGTVQIGNAQTGNIEIGTTTVQAPLAVISRDTVKVTGAVTNTNNKDMAFTGSTVNFDAGSSLAAGSGKTKITADAVNLNGTFSGTGVFAVQKKTAGNFTVGGTSAFLSDAAIGKLAAGNFYNVAIGSKDNAGTATIGEITALPKYTSILTNGALAFTGTVHGAATDTLAVHGVGLTQTSAAGFEVGKLLLFGKGDMVIDSQHNKIGGIAADLTDTGTLTLTNKTDMKVTKIENRNVDPKKDVEGIEAKSTHIKLDAGKKLNVEEKIKTKDDAKLEADDMNLGSKINVGKTLTLEKSDKTQAVSVGTGPNDWNVNNAQYGNIKIGGNGQSGDIKVKDTTFKNPSDIETTGHVKLEGTNKAGADGKSDMVITAQTAELPNATDTLAVKNLDLDLSGGIDLGNGKVKGAEGGKITTKGASNSQDIVISDNAAHASHGEYRISYRTINETLDGFSSFDVAGNQHLYFYGGTVKKSINAAGRLGVVVKDDVTIVGQGTKLKIGADTSKAGYDPDTVITGGFTVEQGKTVHVKGDGGTSKDNGAEINIQTDGDIHLEQGAALKVEGNYAQATLNSRGGNVILNEDAKVKVVDGSTPVWVDVTGNNVQLDARAQLDSGTDTVGALRVHTDKIITPTADDNTTNIVGKSGLVITRKTQGDLTLNSTTSGAGLHITSEQLNGKLFGNEFSELVLGDQRSDTVTIDGLKANNRVVVKTAESGKAVIGAGGLKVGTGYKVTLTTGAIENTGGAGKMEIATGSALNLYTNNIANLVAGASGPSVTGAGTLGIGTYSGAKSIGVGDGAAGDLKLTNDKMTNVFGPNFSHYSIGNIDPKGGATTQDTINVAGSSLGQNTTLQAKHINFTGDMTLASGKILTVNALQDARQTAGKIKTDNLAVISSSLNRDNTVAAAASSITLDKDNEIGTLAADAYAVNVKSNKLTIGTITTPAGAPVPSRTISGVKAGSVTSGGTTNNGNIKLAADEMTFNAAVSGKGALELEQATAGTDINIGKSGTGLTGLTLGADLFGGNKIKDGFEHVYLGRQDVSGKVNVGGTLNFVDATTIRTKPDAGTVDLDASTKINTNGNALNLEGNKLNTAEGSEVNTGTGALTLKADAVDLNGKMTGSKALNILPATHGRDLKMGGNVNDPAKLSLLDKYFSGNNRQFWGYEIINIGDREGGGRLWQSGSIDMPFRVNIQQAVNSSSGSVNLAGNINTHGRDFTIGSREVNLDDTHINADGADRNHDGNVSIQADTLNVTNGSSISGHGEVSFDTYTPGKSISFGTPGAGGTPSGLVLGNDVFGPNGLLKNTDGAKFKKIRVGGDNAGNISVGNVDIPDTLTDGLEIKTGGDVTSTGVMKSVPVLDVTANNVNLTGANEIKKIGNVTSKHGVNIETAKGTTISGKVTGETTPISIKNSGGGDVTIASGGQIIGSGTSDVVIEARGGSFKNKAGADAIKTAPGHKYVVHTEDSVNNEINGLVFQFRKYGMAYDDPHKPQPPAGQNAMYYNYQPTLKFYAVRTYGDDNNTFFNASTAGFHIEDDGNAARRALDKDEVDYIRAHVKDSGTHEFGTTKLTNANADIISEDGTVKNAMTDVRMRTGAHTYGSDSTIANEKITYKGHNELNYKIEVDYRIVPRTVTVRGKTETKTYDGNAQNYTGNNGVTFENFANSQTIANSGTTGAVFYTPIADAKNTSGFAQGALHAGEYATDVSNSTLKASNYNFKYVAGKLTINPINIHFTAPNGERIYGASNDTVVMGSSTTHTGSLVTGDSFASYSVVAMDGTNAVTERTGVGNHYTMTLQGAKLAEGSRSLDSDYKITAAAGTLTIKPRALTITAGDKSRVYGDANAMAGYVNGTGKVNVGATTATSGLVNGDTIDDVTETIDPAALVTTNAGTTGLWTKVDSANFTSGSANNYTITYAPGTFSITKRALTLAAGDKSRIYGTANNTATYVNGTSSFRVKTGSLVNGDAISSVTETIDPAATVTTDAGTAGLKTKIAGAVFGTGLASNYDISYDDGSFAITKRDLTLHAGDKTRVYGAENSTATYTGGTSKFRADAATGTTGLVNGDTVTDVTESTNALITTDAGTTGLKTQITGASFGTGKASNYNITYVDGGFDITKRDLFIKAGDKSRAYGADNSLASYVNGTSRINVRAKDATTGLANGDTISAVTETIDPTVTVTTDAGTTGLWTRVSGATFGTGLDSNYTIHYGDGNFAITPREVKVTAGNAERNYGQPNPVVTAYTVEHGTSATNRGLLPVDSIPITGITSTYAPSITTTTNAGTYNNVITIDPSSVTGSYTGATNLANYRFVYEPGTLTIKPTGFTPSTPGGAAVTTSTTTSSQTTSSMTTGGGGASVGTQTGGSGSIGGGPGPSIRRAPAV